ncbi:hemerythrin HHE cation binding domain-containing protein [Streptomyces sp. 1114.5]|nr:hemerythrin HHE cation binding domain-containing protein [Streptomyces sp. 1114.5]
MRATTAGPPVRQDRTIAPAQNGLAPPFNRSRRRTETAMNGAEGFPSRLCAEHRAIEALLRQLDRITTRRGTDDEALRLLDALRRLLEPHLAAEEDHLYPLARRALPNGEALADAAVHTHTAIRRLLDRADDGRLTPTERRHAMSVLVVVVRSHLRGEEEQLFPALRVGGAPEDLRRCERRMREARAPRAGGPVWGLPPGAGAIAALRDGVSGHRTSGDRHSP